MTAKTKRCWSVEPAVQASRELLSWCLSQQNVDRMLVVVRMEQHDKKKSYSTVPEVERRTKALFEPNLLEDFQASAWPGTELIKHSAHVFVVRFNESIAEVILRIEPDLTKWRHPSNRPLPEDICLFNSNASSPTLVSVTHEKLFWIIAEQKPKLAGVRETNLRDEKLFWHGKYFCRPWGADE